MTRVPQHLALIMDGNGRWATGKGRPRWMGHARGAHTAREVVAYCAQRGVEQLTLYAFSSDNWKRPADEVGFLFDLFASHLERQLDKLLKHGIRLSVIGRRDRLPRALCDAIEATEARTAHGSRMHLRVAVDYSSRAAIHEAFAMAKGSGDATKARKSTRKVYFRDHGFVECTVYDRTLLLADDKLNGPALLEAADSTTVVPPGWLVRCDAVGNLIVTHEGKAA